MLAMLAPLQLLAVGLVVAAARSGGRGRKPTKAPPTKGTTKEPPAPPNQRQIEKETLDSILGNRRSLGALVVIVHQVRPSLAATRQKLKCGAA
jgi:hypothetical protein